MQSSMRRLSIGLVIVLLLSSVAAWAQAGTGELTGNITDQTGAVILKADIALVNNDTGVQRTTKPTTAGTYAFSALPVGTYTLTIKAEGFRDFRAANLVVSVGATVNMNVKMELGSASEMVTVEAGMQQVQTTESQVSSLVDSRVWQNMPLETRNQNSFILLVPGATPDTSSTRGASVNGARGGTGNYMVEGMDNNDQGQGGRGQLSGYDDGGAATSISPDAIQEYRVVTNSFAAEYGKAGGFITDTVLKSGTNKFHGSLFEYNRIQALAANGWFSNRTIDPVTGKKTQDRLVRNQFGGSFGGPVIKDRTFFFASAEIHRAREAGSLHAVATTQPFLDWVNGGGLQSWAETSTSGVCNNQDLVTSVYGKNADGTPKRLAAPCAGAFGMSNSVGSIFNSMAKIGPFPLGQALPCTPGVSGDPCAAAGFYTEGVSEFPVAAYSDIYVPNPYQLNEWRISAKVDHKISDRDQLNGVLMIQDAFSGDKFGGGGNAIGPAYVNDGRSVNLGLNWNHTFSNTVLNTFKASFLRHRSDFPSPGAQYDGMPQIYTWNDSLSVGLGMYSGLPQYFTDNQFQYQDHIAIVKGNHNLKTGVEYRRTRNGSRFFNDKPGSFFPWSVEDLFTDLAFTEEANAALNGLPCNVPGGVCSNKTNPGSVYYASAAVDMSNKQVPDFYRGFRANEMAAYFQDDWRVNNRLTVNLGLRYEYFGPPHNFKQNIDSNFYFGTPVTPVQTASTNMFFPTNSPFANMVATGNFQVRNNEIWNKDTNNFGPRLGFAFDVLGNQKLVFRAGAGMMYDRIYNNVFENIRFNPPYFSDNQIGYAVGAGSVGAISTPGLYGYPFTATASFGDPAYAPKPNPRHMDQNLVSPYYEQLHAGFQWEFANGYMFEPEYVFTAGHQLIGYYDINTFNGRVASAAGSSTRINSNIGADNYRTNCCSSNYHGLQLQVRKNYTNGLGFQANYTWSKTMDSLSDLFNYRNTAATDVTNLKYDYAPADFDLRHRFVTNFTYELPFMKSNRWIGGWSVNSIISIQSGTPFSVYASSTGYDANKDGRGGDRLMPAGVAPMSTTTGKTPADGYFDTTQWARYTCPADVNQGMWCNPPIGRNSMTGPGYWNTDLGISKKFKVTERAVFTLQGNFFNLFNHPNFGLPSGNQSSGSFGKSTSAFAARVTQLALRFDF